MQSRNEEILQAIINGDDLSNLPFPQSRIEALLIRLGEIIEEGGGGGGGAVDDVQINGTSIVDGEGVANVPVNTERGVIYDGSVGLSISPAIDNDIKGQAQQYRPITPLKQHRATFYGLAKAAGDTTQASSSNAVGTYTESAKSAISQMLSGSVPITGTTPSITALPGIRYVCGEVATLAITLPASGIVDVTFASGSTPTVLTVTPPSGVTVHWPEWFDPDNLEASVTYEISIADGFGAVSVWA